MHGSGLDPMRSSGPLGPLRGSTGNSQPVRLHIYHL